MSTEWDRAAPATQSASHGCGLSRKYKPPHARTRSGGHAAFIQDLPSANLQSQSDSSRGFAEGPADRAQGKRSRTFIRRSRRCVTSTTATIVLALLVLAPTANATYNPLGSGQTKLTLARPFLSLLAANNVKLTGKEGATLKGGVASFPVSGGKFDPTTSNGASSNTPARSSSRPASRRSHSLPCS